MRKSTVVRDNEKERLRMINDIQDEVIDNIHKQLKDDDINFTSDMSESFKKGKEGEFHTVETDNKYAGFIEFGMPAGTAVDFNALRIWVEGKLGIHEGDELTTTTWAIYKAILKNGLYPRRYFKKAIRKTVGVQTVNAAKTNSSAKGAKISFGSKIKKAVKNVKKLISGFKSSKMRKKVG